MSAPAEAIAVAVTAPATLGNQLARWLLGITCFFWGTTQIAPAGAALDLSLGLLNYGDITFAMLAGLMMTTSPSFRSYLLHFVDRYRAFTLLMILLTALGVMSAFTNAIPRSLAFSDIFEVLRPGVYLFIAMTVSYFTRMGYVRVVVLCLPLGIIGASVDNMYRVLTGDEAAIAEILRPLNPNVVGNMVSIALVYLAIAFAVGAQFRATLLMFLGMLLIAFSYSKGAWLMGLIGLGCFAGPYLHAARARVLGWRTRWLVLSSLLAAMVVIALNTELISRMIEMKLAQSFTSEVNQSQSTVALRVGHMYSSLEIVSRNPVFGVGVTNWEKENDNNAYWLNDIYLWNDNPHNGFFYVLSGMGIPALFVFLALTIFPVTLLPKALGLRGLRRFVFASCLLLILLICGNVMLQLLSHYFLWVLCGIATGLTPGPDQKDATAAAEMPRL